MGQGTGKHIVESPLRNAEEGKNKTGKKNTALGLLEKFLVRQVAHLSGCYERIKHPFCFLAN